MTDLAAIQLPLYNFFMALRQNGFLLGIDEYYTLLEALQHKHGLNLKEYQIDKQRLLAVCKTLWLKPKQSHQVFEDLFHETFESFVSAELSELSPDENGSEDSSVSADNAQEEVKLDNLPNNDATDVPASEDRDTVLERHEETEVTTNQEQTSVTQQASQRRLKYAVDANAGNGKQTTFNYEQTRKFFYNPHVFALTPRQMQQACRFLPVYQSRPNQHKLDIDQTIAKQAHTGFFAEPVFKPQTVIHNQVILLTDHGGSMVAFEALSNAFAQALGKAFDTPQKLTCYFFYNVPHRYCYLNQAHTRSVSLEALHQQICKHPHTHIIIIGDGGAARGGNSDGRFEATLKFLLSLGKVTRKIVWLNPMPQPRWEYTTAQRIARLVPMFALDSPASLNEAIHYLKKH